MADDFKRHWDAGRFGPACLLKDGLETMPRLHCHACHDTLADDMRFCGHCGAPVPEEPAAQGDSVRAALEAKLQSQYRIVRLLSHGGMGSRPCGPQAGMLLTPAEE